MMRFRILVLGPFLAASVAGQDEPASAKLFEEKIGPILTARCAKCHGAEAPKPKGGAGDLLVTVDVDVPSKLSREQKEVLTRLRELEKESPRKRIGV